jgi:hypothetical protein
MTMMEMNDNEDNNVLSVPSFGRIGLICVFFLKDKLLLMYRIFGG